jgi:hypothetical protein
VGGLRYDGLNPKGVLPLDKDIGKIGVSQAISSNFVAGTAGFPYRLFFVFLSLNQ